MNGGMSEEKEKLIFIRVESRNRTYIILFGSALRCCKMKNAKRALACSMLAMLANSFSHE